MKGQGPSPAKDQVAEEALAWMLAFENGEMGDVEQRAGFVAWLKSSPVHVDEFMQASALHEALRSLPLPGLSDIDQLIEQVRDVVVPIPNPPQRHQAEPIDPDQATKAGAKRRGVGRYRLVAATAVVLAMVVPFGFVVVAPNGTSYETMPGETRSLTLEDGSRIDLEEQTKVLVDITDASRSAELLRGKVQFDVEQDSGRPLTVDAIDLITRVIGTQFSMRRDMSAGIIRTELTMTEGRVSVTNTLDIDLQAMLQNSTKDSNNATAADANKHSLILSDGDQITVTNDADIGKVTLVAKVKDQLVFDNAPLSEAIEAINRYTEQHLVVTAPSIIADGITGTFDIRGSNTLPNLIIRRHPELKSHRVGNAIHIYEADPPRSVPAAGSR